MVHIIPEESKKIQCIDLWVRLNPYNGKTYTFLDLNATFDFGGSGRSVDIDLNQNTNTQLQTLSETINCWWQWLNSYQNQMNITLEKLTDYVRIALTETPIFDYRKDCSTCWNTHVQETYAFMNRISEEGAGDFKAQKILDKEMREHCDEVRKALSDQPNHKFKLPPFC
jgi:hypothetical protein